MPRRGQVEAPALFPDTDISLTSPVRWIEVAESGRPLPATMPWTFPDEPVPGRCLVAEPTKGKSEPKRRWILSVSQGTWFGPSERTAWAMDPSRDFQPDQVAVLIRGLEMHAISMGELATLMSDTGGTGPEVAPAVQAAVCLERKAEGTVADRPKLPRGVDPGQLVGAVLDELRLGKSVLVRLDWSLGRPAMERIVEETLTHVLMGGLEKPVGLLRPAGRRQQGKEEPSRIHRFPDLLSAGLGKWPDLGLVVCWLDGLESRRKVDPRVDYLEAIAWRCRSREIPMVCFTEAVGLLPAAWLGIALGEALSILDVTDGSAREAGPETGEGVTEARLESASPAEQSTQGPLLLLSARPMVGDLACPRCHSGASCPRCGGALVLQTQGRGSTVKCCMCRWSSEAHYPCRNCGREVRVPELHHRVLREGLAGYGRASAAQAARLVDLRSAGSGAGTLRAAVKAVSSEELPGLTVLARYDQAWAVLSLIRPRSICLGALRLPRFALRDGSIAERAGGLLELARQSHGSLCREVPVVVSESGADDVVARAWRAGSLRAFQCELAVERKRLRLPPFGRLVRFWLLGRTVAEVRHGQALAKAYLWGEAEREGDLLRLYEPLGVEARLGRGGGSEAGVAVHIMRPIGDASSALLRRVIPELWASVQGLRLRVEVDPDF